MKNRLFIFAHYDKDSIIDDYVIYYLKKLYELGDIIFISDNELNNNQKNKINNLVIKTISIKHGEYDFGSYKIGLNYLIKNNLINKYDYIIFCNDSVYGPFFPLEPIFKKMEKRNPDVWGFTKNKSNLKPHLQSYFISLSNNIINDKNILNFFHNIKKEENKSDIVKKYEIGLSKLLYKNDYKLISFININVKFPYLPLEIHTLKSIKNGYPFLKKKIIIENRLLLPKLYKNSYIKIISSNYPFKLIENNAIRLIGYKKYEKNLNVSKFYFMIKIFIFLFKRLPYRIIKQLNMSKKIINNCPPMYNTLVNLVYYLNKITNYSLEKYKFYKSLGYKLNLKNPKSFNEKITWKKINDRNPLLPITADKYRVRQYIKDILGEKEANEILIPLLYVGDDPKKIPFEDLPDEYIIKANHNSGPNFIKRKNDKINKKEIILIFKKQLKKSYGTEKNEWAYQKIPRKIIIEKLLIDENGKIPKDYKFHMNHNQCEFVRVFSDRQTNLSAVTYDENWNFLPNIKINNIPIGVLTAKPPNFKKMLEIAKKLSKKFDYIRVDLYTINNKIYFGELTHYPGSGRAKIEPRLFDFKLGDKWKLDPNYYKNHD